MDIRSFVRVKSVRDHWSVENQLHWQLDVTFGEDAAKRIRNAALNFSLINKIALSILKRYKDRIPAEHESLEEANRMEYQHPFGTVRTRCMELRRMNLRFIRCVGPGVNKGS